MDPTHHEKIVDKLMQYRGKIPKEGHLSSKAGNRLTREMRRDIDYLINSIEWMAAAFEKELIK